MSRQFAKTILDASITASGAIGEYRFVTPACAQAGAGVNTLGVARMAAASGEVIPVDILGTTLVETGAALTAGGLLQTDASARAIDKAAGVSVARLLPGQAATAAGQFVEVLLLPN